MKCPIEENPLGKDFLKEVPWIQPIMLSNTELDESYPHSFGMILDQSSVYNKYYQAYNLFTKSGYGWTTQYETTGWVQIELERPIKILSIDVVNRRGYEACNTGFISLQIPSGENWVEVQRADYPAKTSGLEWSFQIENPVYSNKIRLYRELTETQTAYIARGLQIHAVYKSPF